MNLVTPASWFLRLALAASFLSAVADRFGLWGAPGSPGVAWGAWQPFLEYTGTLCFFLPKSLVPAAGALATAAEVTLALWLLSGWKLRVGAAAAGILLLIFAISMTVTGGPKGPLDYSVFTASAGAFLLAVVAVRKG